MSKKQIQAQSQKNTSASSGMLENIVTQKDLRVSTSKSKHRQLISPQKRSKQKQKPTTLIKRKIKPKISPLYQQNIIWMGLLPRIQQLQHSNTFSRKQKGAPDKQIQTICAYLKNTFTKQQKNVWIDLSLRLTKQMLALSQERQFLDQFIQAVENQNFQTCCLAIQRCSHKMQRKQKLFGACGKINNLIQQAKIKRFSGGLSTVDDTPRLRQERQPESTAQKMKKMTKKQSSSSEKLKRMREIFGQYVRLISVGNLDQANNLLRQSYPRLKNETQLFQVQFRHIKQLIKLMNRIFFKEDPIEQTGKLQLINECRIRLEQTLIVQQLKSQKSGVTSMDQQHQEQRQKQYSYMLKSQTQSQSHQSDILEGEDPFSLESFEKYKRKMSAQNQQQQEENHETLEKITTESKNVITDIIHFGAEMLTESQSFNPYRREKTQNTVDFQHKLKLLETNLIQQQHYNNKLNREMQQVKIQLNKKQYQAQSMKIEYESLKGQYEDLQGELNIIKQLKDDQYYKCVSEKKKLKRQLQILFQEVNSVKQQSKKKLQHSDKIFQNQVRQLNGQIQRLEEEILALRGYINGLRVIMLLESSSILTPSRSEMQKNFLVNQIQTTYQQKINSFELLYKYNKERKLNFHSFINKCPNIMALITLQNGVMIGGYSHQPLVKQKSSKNGFIFSLTDKEAFHLKQKTAMQYDEYYLVFGNSQIRIKVAEQLIFSNFGIVNANFNSGGKKVKDFLKCGNSRQAVMEKLEIYAVHYENS